MLLEATLFYRRRSATKLMNANIHQLHYNYLQERKCMRNVITPFCMIAPLYFKNTMLKIYKMIHSCASGTKSHSIAKIKYFKFLKYLYSNLDGRQQDRANMMLI